MKCQLSLAQKIRSIEEKLIVLDKFEIHKKMSFEEKIMNISKKLQLAKKVPKSEHFCENIFNLQRNLK